MGDMESVERMQCNMRTRKCENPIPLNGGKDCIGSSTDIVPCTQPVCIIDGGWTSWTSSACSVSCGEGTLTKTRTCTNPAPQNGGKACAENDTAIERCSHVCPVDGNWGAWTSWGICTVTCGSGEQVRTRHCDNPAPVGTGAHCKGPPGDVQACVTKQCPIDGGWSSWSIYTSCSLTCGNGTVSRFRSCNHPSPQHGGAACHGLANETHECNIVPCPVDGGWGAWQPWSGCTQTCGGQQYRQRSCDNPPRQHNGRDCIGPSSGLLDCPTVCPHAWSAWSQWTNCTVQCGQGHQKRTRTCLPSSTRRRDIDCFGLAEEIKVCDAGSCASQFKVCDKVRVFTAIFHATNVNHTGSATCPDHIHHPDVAVIEEFCSAPTDTSLWTKGLQVYGHCESIPLYVPIGKVDSANKITENGILLECITDGFKNFSSSTINSEHFTIRPAGFSSSINSEHFTIRPAGFSSSINSEHFTIRPAGVSSSINSEHFTIRPAGFSSSINSEHFTIRPAGFSSSINSEHFTIRPAGFSSSINSEHFTIRPAGFSSSINSEHFTIRPAGFSSSINSEHFTIRPAGVSSSINSEHFTIRPAGVSSSINSEHFTIRPAGFSSSINSEHFTIRPAGFSSSINSEHFTIRPAGFSSSINSEHFTIRPAGFSSSINSEHFTIRPAGFSNQSRT
ncbi:hypothetical protein ACJMK2_040384 [Sinanodonta woodiana]|uniref:Hemicentin-1 n=1 Tax=Sinanodonta woodiana TaxID=1069815 RepID=A0ABD3WG18_SINWO